MTPKIPKLSSNWQKRGVILSMILLVCIITTYAFFTDRASIQTNFITSTFKKDGYTLTNTMPSTPFAAGDDVTVVITESNSKSEAISSNVTMRVSWSSPDTTKSIFNNPNDADNVTLRLDGEPVSYSENADGSISFDLPTQTLTAGASNVVRSLTLHIPESLATTGELSFGFEKATIQQSPNGFKQEYDSTELSGLTHSTKIGWPASADTENNGKNLMAYLTSAGDGSLGLQFEHYNNISTSVMKTYTASSLPAWSAYKDKIKNIQFIDGMTTIGDYAFKDFTNITSISLPTSITSIGTYAFDSTSLATLTIPASVAELKAMSFGHIDELTQITFNHSASDSLFLPAGGSTTGAFYLDSYVETTISGDNAAVTSYDWVADNRSKNIPPVLAASNTWLTRGLLDNTSAYSAITTVAFLDEADPAAYSTWTSWDGSEAGDGSVKVYYNGSDQVVVAGNGTGKLIANADSSYLFSNSAVNKRLTGLKTISNLNLLDTSETTNMASMFSNCQALESVDVGSFNTSNVISMANMFYNCEKLQSLAVDTWVTSSVQYMNAMFQNCKYLNSLNVKNWNTSSVRDMNAMFNTCQALTSLDVATWNTANVTDFSFLFNSCSSLDGLNVADWNLSSATSTRGMFQNCANLTSLNVSGWEMSSCADFTAMFKGCERLSGIDISSWDMSGIGTEYTNASDLFNGCKAFTSLTFPAAVNYLADRMAANCPNLTTIEFLTNSIDLTYKPTPGADTGSLYVSPDDAPTGVVTTLKVTSANSAMAKIKDQSVYNITLDNRRFQINSSGKTLPVLAEQNTWLTRGFASDYTGYSSITSISFYDKVNSADYPDSTWTSWDGSQAGDGSITVYYNDTTKAVVVAGNGWGEIVANADSSYLFSFPTADSSKRLTSLTTITGLELLDTSNATTMRFMFTGCSALQAADVSGFVTSSVTDMTYMFSECRTLQTLAVNTWDTSSVTDMSHMFYACQALQNLNVSGWVTSNVTNMSSMFEDCQALQNTDVTSWNVSSVQTLDSMFSGCQTFSALDVSTWNTANTASFKWFARNCPNLTTIKLGESFAADAANLPAAGSTSGMFYVSSYVDTSVTGMSAAMQDYFWAGDNRAPVVVTYNANGGTFTNGTDTNKVSYFLHDGSEVTNNYEKPTNEDFDFVGWFTDAECTTAFNRATDITSLTSNPVVYAKWQAVVKYNITYNTNGGTLPAGAPTTYTSSKGATLPTPTNDDKLFYGWTDNNGDSLGYTLGSGWVVDSNGDLLVTDTTGNLTITNSGKFDSGYNRSISFSVTDTCILSFTYFYHGIWDDFGKSYGARYFLYKDNTEISTEHYDGSGLHYTGSVDLSFTLSPGSYSVAFEGVTSEEGTYGTTGTISNFIIQKPFKELSKGTTGDKSLTANWGPAVIAVNYNASSGKFSNESSLNSVYYTPGTNTEASGKYEVPTRTGYIFDGWQTGSGETFDLSTISSLSVDTTIYAKWMDEKTAVVTFEPNSGYFVGLGTTPIQTRYNTVVGKYAISHIQSIYSPSKDGYSFAGWYTDPACSEGNEFDNSTGSDDLKNLTEDITVYAKWKEKTSSRSITYYLKNGGTFSGTSSITNTVVYTKSLATGNITITDGTYLVPERGGYTFAGWYKDSDCTSGNELVLSSDFDDLPNYSNVYPKWTQIPGVTVTYNANGGSFSDGSSTNAVTYSLSSGSIISGGGSLKTPSKSGYYQFVEWQYANGSTFSTDASNIKTLTGNVTVYAKYRAKPVLQQWSSSASSDFHAYKDQITSVEFLQSYSLPSNVTYGPWDVSADQNKSVMAYMVGTKVSICNNQAVTEISRKVVANTYSAAVFQNFSALNSVTNPSNLDTSNVRSFASMFSWCANLTSLDLNSWDTSNATSLVTMFNQCSSLTSLSISNWNVSNVSAMDYLFSGCTRLTSLNVSGWNVSSVKTMENAFNRCNSSIIPSWYVNSASATSLSLNASEGEITGYSVE